MKSLKEVKATETLNYCKIKYWQYGTDTQIYTIILSGSKKCHIILTITFANIDQFK